MGQMTFAVLYGVHQPPPKKLYEGWWTLIERYQKRAPAGALMPSVPSGDGDSTFLGFWCAVGASGKEGVPDLSVPFALNAFGAACMGYSAALDRAVEAWRAFSSWACADVRGVVLPSPQLYLVETEVA
jgi:hypothetical protein